MPRFISSAILAEFDIEKGSVIKAQYPYNLSMPESELANIMLPSGAHKHDLDWSIFILKKEYLAEDKGNFKKVKFDNKAKILVKSKSHKNSFFETKNENIELKVKENGISIEFGQLNEIQTTADNIEFLPSSLVISGADKRYEMFFDDKNDYKRFLDVVKRQEKLTQNYYLLNIVKEEKNKIFKRGNRYIAVGIVTRFPIFSIFRELLKEAIEQYLKSNDVDVLKKLHDLKWDFRKNSLNNNSMHLIFSNKNYQLTKNDYIKKNSTFYEKLNFFNSNFKNIEIDISLAILQEKRIVILSQKSKIIDICFSVLAICLFGGPLFEYLISNVVYTYTDIFFIDFLKKEETYIIGVANPLFKEKTNLWDIFIDIDKQTITKSENYKKETKMPYFRATKKRLKVQMKLMKSNNKEKTRFINKFRKLILFLLDFDKISDFEITDKKFASKLVETKWFKRLKLDKKFGSSLFFDDNENSNFEVKSHLINITRVGKDKLSILKYLISFAVEFDENKKKLVFYLKNNNAVLEVIMSLLFVENKEIREHARILLREIMSVECGKTLLEQSNAFLKYFIENK